MDKLRILYDGRCHLCYREIQHYLKKDKNQLIDAIDISSNDFDPSSYNLSFDEVNLHLHTIDSQNNIYKGIDAFIQIWSRLPMYHYIIPIFSNKILRPLWDLQYEVFAKYIRQNLPKRKCQNGHCKL